jgi:D-3-phosphoglycerate dehydrogenase
MPVWKILLTDGLEEIGQEILRAEANVDDRGGISAEELLHVSTGYDAMIVRGRTRVSAQVFDTAVKLKVIGRVGVGVDNIDLAAANKHNVTVVNAPTATSQAVAELALGLILALARNIPRADASMKTGQWLKNSLVGIEVSGKVLAILGMGNIGSALAKRGAALGMHVIGYDAFLSTEEIARRGVEPVPLADLYARADFLSLHVPLTPETRGMIDGQTLGQMKRGVRLVCTARGGVIDETALLGALESGQVAGAALDVHANEPPGLTALVAHPDVIATPHIGAQTEEAQVRSADDIAHEVLAALNGQPLRWKVV